MPGELGTEAFGPRVFSVGALNTRAFSSGELSAWRIWCLRNSVPAEFGIGAFGSGIFNIGALNISALNNGAFSPWGIWHRDIELWGIELRTIFSWDIKHPGNFVPWEFGIGAFGSGIFRIGALNIRA